MSMIRSTLPLAILLACAACGTSSPISGVPGSDDNAAARGQTPVATPTASVSASALHPLEPSDAERIDGELACSFGEGATGAPLMLARADVDASARGSAVVRMSAGPRLLQGATGGFTSVERGGIFTVDRLTVRVTPGARVPETGEEVVRSAMMTVSEGGMTQTFQGMWRCGP